MLKYFDNSIKEDAGNNLLDNNLLSDDPLSNNSLIYINSNINMDSKAKLNFDENMTNNNLLEKNSGINIKDLFQ